MMKWLNGKKTIIGAIMFVVVAALRLLGVDMPTAEMPDSWWELVRMLPELFAASISTIGLLHKIFKRNR